MDPPRMCKEDRLFICSLMFFVGLISMVFGMVIGVWVGHSSHGSPIVQMREQLMKRCANAPDILTEIDQKLPDNDEGLITPEILRHVLADVVNHC